MSLEEFFPHLLVDRDDSLTGEEASAVFSPDRAYRYALTRRWDTTKTVAVWVMLNPSTADSMADDPTIRRCRSFSQGWGYGGLLVVNVFGLRATDPKALRTSPDPVGPDNDHVIYWFLSGEYGPVPSRGPVIAAWGVNGARLGRGDHLARLLAEQGATVRCLGRTSAGHPRHPLYVSGDTVLEPYATESAEVSR